MVTQPPQTPKAHIQKVYEKFAMVKEAGREFPRVSLSVMLARDSQGVPSLILMVGNVPIAQFLHEPNDLSPDFDKSETIMKLFQSASAVDTREDYDTDSPEVTAVFDNAGYERFDPSVGFWVDA